MYSSAELSDRVSAALLQEKKGSRKCTAIILSHMLSTGHLQQLRMDGDGQDYRGRSGCAAARQVMPHKFSAAHCAGRDVQSKLVCTGLQRR